MPRATASFAPTLEMGVPAPGGLKARVWDLPIRLFHWWLVALLAFSWWSGEQHEMDWHRRSGCAILALLVFRIYWGVWGSRTARFAQFVRGPQAVLAYVRSRGGNAAASGHNPVGGWSIILMLAVLTAMVVAGLFSVDVDGLESGPLADYVSFDSGRIAATIHHIVFNILLTLAAIHIVAILFYLVRLRRNLVMPMIHGYRVGDLDEPIEPLGSSAWKAALGMIVAGGVAYAAALGFHF